MSNKDEREHLFDLAYAADRTPASARAHARPSRKQATRPGLHWALNAITEGVAIIRNAHQDLLATNELGRAFYPPVIGDGAHTANLARFQFLDPASHEFYPDWNPSAETCVGIMRAEARRDRHNKHLQNLVGELSMRSEAFSRLWGTHRMFTPRKGINRFRHPVVGEVSLAYEELAISTDPGHFLLIYTAEPGSRSAERLRLLASWAASETPTCPNTD